MSDALITTFRIRFANQICQEELPFLRGASGLFLEHRER